MAGYHLTDKIISISTVHRLPLAIRVHIDACLPSRAVVRRPRGPGLVGANGGAVRPFPRLVDVVIGQANVERGGGRREQGLEESGLGGRLVVGYGGVVVLLVALVRRSGIAVLGLDLHVAT